MCTAYKELMLNESNLKNVFIALTLFYCIYKTYVQCRDKLSKCVTNPFKLKHALTLSMYVCLQLVAEDIDSQLNGAILYSIISGDRDNQFFIDPLRGVIKVNKQLDRETVRSTDTYTHTQTQTHTQILSLQQNCRKSLTNVPHSHT